MECDIGGKAKADLGKYAEQIIPANGEEPLITRAHEEEEEEAEEGKEEGEGEARREKGGRREENK
eukprot:1773546-Pyramimonas_sp.AAC.1